MLNYRRLTQVNRRFTECLNTWDCLLPVLVSSLSWLCCCSLKCDKSCGHDNLVMKLSPSNLTHTQTTPSPLPPPRYLSAKDPAYVNYMRFSDEVESIFTHKNLEKTPTAEVQQFVPSVEVDLNILSPEEEQILQKLCTDWLRGWGKKSYNTQAQSSEVASCV